MLKIENLELQAGEFHGDETGAATLRIADPSDGGVELKGKFKFENVGTATVAAVGVAGTVTAAVEDINLNDHGDASPKGMKLTLKADIVREYTVAAGTSTIVTGFDAVDAVERVDGVAVASVAIANGKNVTVTSAAEAGKLTLKLKGVIAATGWVANDDVAMPTDKLTLEAGETSAKDVHVDILSNLRVNPGNKPNLTHFSVRGAKLHF
jgi:hypothetical protein